MRRTYRTIQGALPLLARAVGRKLDVTVGIGGDSAHTNGSHIQLPSLPIDMPTEELETLAFGYLEHEAAHVRYTDFDDYKPDQGAHRMFSNIIEDIRIEKELGEAYPGFATDLQKLTALLVERGEMGADPTPDASLAQLMGSYVLLRGRHDVLGPDELGDAADKAEKAFRKAVTPGLATRVSAALNEIEGLTSTREAVELARDLLRFVREEQAQQEQQSQPPADSHGQMSAAGGQSGPGGDGGDADAQPEAGGGSGSKDEPAGESDNDRKGDGANSGAADGSATEDDPTGQPDAEDESDEEKREAARKMAEALNGLLEDDGMAGPKGPGEAAAEALQQEARQAPAYGAGDQRTSQPIVPKGAATAELARVAAATGALRARLQGLLASVKRSSRTPARRGKRFDPRRLIRARTGDPRVFVAKKPGVAVNTAVQILLDRSGSMSRRMKLARESALACSLALEGISGVAVAASAFPGFTADVEPLSRFGQTVRATAGRYAAVAADGGTPMIEALLWGAEQLAMRPEPRKVCLVVTDGYPYDRETTAELVRRCWAGNIEVLGIGIGTDPEAMKAVFPVTRVVDSVNDLAEAMFTMLRETLSGRPVA